MYYTSTFKLIFWLSDKKILFKNIKYFLRNTNSNLLLAYFWCTQVCNKFHLCNNININIYIHKHPMTRLFRLITAHYPT